MSQASLTPNLKCHLLTPTPCCAFIRAQASRATTPAQPNLSWAGDPGLRPHRLGSTSQRDRLQAQTCLTAPRARILGSSQSPRQTVPREQSPEQSHLLIGLRDRLCWERGETETPLRHRAGPSRSQASVHWEGESLPQQVPGTSPKRLHKGSSVQQLLQEGLRRSSLPGDAVGICCERRGQSGPQGLPPWPQPYTSRWQPSVRPQHGQHMTGGC